MSNASFSRREVLRLLATSFAALVPFHVRDVRAQSADSSVLIIGAGVAGLAAAQMLQAEGWQVTVLEARDRIGGRIWTNRSLGGLPLDLGASWIHGVDGNPLTELADAAKITRIATDYENMLVYRDDGTLVDDEQIQALEALLLTILETADEFAGEYDGDISLGRIIREAIEEEADDLSSDEQMLIAYLVNTSIEHEYGASVEQLSAFYWQSGEYYSGGDAISVQGYDWLINLLASGLDIRLNTPVELIEYDDEAVYISADGEEWEADYALITVPLGVLKAGTIQFDPPLPDRKLAAIDTLQMGTLNKLYLRFPAVFWDQEMDFIDIASAQEGQSVEMLNISLIHDQPVLLCFYAADFARTIESWEDARVVEHTMDMLRAVYGTEIPEPDSYLLTRWGQDVYSYGSYSFYGVESTPDDRLALAEPVADRLFFAGEATHDTDPSTVHGALLSGWRAAEELLDLE